MTEPAFLDGLKCKCGSEIRYYDLVELSYLGKTKKVYLAVGKHAVYFVKRSLSRVLTGGEVYFMHIDKFIEDINKDTDLKLELNEQRDAVWVVGQLTLTTVNRSTLVSYLNVAYTSDRMYRTGKLSLFPHYTHKLSLTRQESERPKVVPFIDSQEIQYEGYFLFIRKGFEDRAGSAMQTGTFMDARGMAVTIIVHRPLPLLHVEKIAREDVRFVALAYKRGITQHLVRYVVSKSQPYLKKMNLSDDVAEWTGWQVIVRTADYTVVCIILRRQYIPPLLDTCQDIAVVYKMSLEDQKAWEMTDGDFLREAYLAADSVAPISQDHVWYKDMVQAKLDALLFPDDGYRWIRRKLKVTPSIFARAKSFFQSILDLFRRENILPDADDMMDSLGREIEVDEDPMRVVLEAVRQGEGVDPLDDSDEGKRLLNEWQMRVANYFGFCIEHELLEAKFGLGDITDAIGLAKPEPDAKIREILYFLLHTRPRDMTLPYRTPRSPIDDLADVDKSVIFNPHIMKAYLDFGYIAKLFPKGSEGSYLKLLAVLLESPSSPLNLKTSVCRQIFEAASAQVVSAEVFAPLIPGLINVVSRPDNPSSSSYLSAFALAALVKLSLLNIPVKNMLMNWGIARMIAKIVRAREDDLTEHALTLMAYCLISSISF
eukprot:GHVS01005728.1.p1 GENE.GHVS01005728.1~~GHVS01005728.1.p1  ORF type:complete len:692 (+),score=87.99 GHVS01005728.1:112-2076(+)